MRAEHAVNAESYETLGDAIRRAVRLFMDSLLAELDRDRTQSDRVDALHLAFQPAYSSRPTTTRRLESK